MGLTPNELAAWTDIRRRLEPEMKRRWWSRVNWPAVAIIVGLSLVALSIWLGG